MKLTIFFAILMTITAFSANAQDKVVADFDKVNPNSSWGWDDQPTVTNNPFKNGINTSKQVLEWKKSSGTWKAFVIAFDDVDVSKNPLVTFKFYSPVSGKISARVETGNEGETLYFNIDITEANKWVTYTTDLTSLLKSAKTFKQASFFINPENDADTNTYYLDDLTFAQKK